MKQISTRNASSRLRAAGFCPNQLPDHEIPTLFSPSSCRTPANGSAATVSTSMPIHAPALFILLTSAESSHDAYLTTTKAINQAYNPGRSYTSFPLNIPRMPWRRDRVADRPTTLDTKPRRIDKVTEQNRLKSPRCRDIKSIARGGGRMRKEASIEYRGREPV